MSSRSNGVTNVLFTRADDRVGGLVRGVLGLAHPLGDLGLGAAGRQHLAEELGADDEVVGRLGEEVVERAVDRAELQTHGELRTGGG